MPDDEKAEIQPQKYKYTPNDLHRTKEPIKDPEEVKERVESYIQYCNENHHIPRLLGIVLLLGLKDKYELEEMRTCPEYANALNLAFNSVEYACECCLTNPKTTTGAIFHLKNLGWSDTPQVAVINVDKGAIERKAIQMAALKALRESTLKAIDVEAKLLPN